MEYVCTELLNIEDIKLNPLDKPLDRDNMGPSLLTIMEVSHT